ncbi:hypothetical protein RND81_14G188000 [Saponaria officinalis]|uniref:Uncharacterized protein n=1 Tax=Saponaria officinalis TaxID=3572 RepID=A0AAW1GZG8_SAPOF
MATGVVITVAGNLFSVLTSQEFKEICSMFGYESKVEELADTVSTINAVLHDAELKHQELTQGGREYIERLKDAVYDVDDVLDEFNTLVRMENGKSNHQTLKKVRRLFSRSNPFLVCYNMFHEVKKLREKLDRIAKNRQQFGLSDVFEPPKERKETGSYVREEGIIGRKADTEAIVGLLLGESEEHQSDVQENVAFVSIVGMGGLGKTALAQLVYNDDKIKDAFEVRLWVCVSNEFGMEQILAKMTGKNVGLGMEQLQREVRNMIEGRKYLLVLDDVWDENHNKWVELKDFLMLGGNGSRVLTTSRLRAVAKAIESNHMYILRGLSDENSWRLFERMAFEQGKAPLDHDLVDIGKDVVKKCANVPLSIRVVGSFLRGQHKSKWLSFRSTDLRKLGSSKDGQAEDADGRSIEDVGDDYFSILLNRCFIQDIRKDSDGEINSCKMHDLIHDLALEVAGKETLALETSVFKLDQKIRHLSIGNDWCKLLISPSICFGEMKKLRTFLHNDRPTFHQEANESYVNMICSNMRRLRVLDLTFFGLRFLPNTLGSLLHLRYLNLSNNYNLTILPESITKLQNLLVLDLRNSCVRELPKGLRNLHNLRHLELSGCTNLTHMPVGMGSMVSLQTLSKFVVAGKISKHVKTGQLKDLRSLVNLKDRLEIVFRSGFSYDLAKAFEVVCLLNNKVHLNELVVRWEENASDEHNKGAIHEILLEGLRPHCNIKAIEIRGYKGVKIPSWVGSLAVFCPCLVDVSLHGFDWLYNLPSLCQLAHLETLELSSMPNLEFVECDDEDASSDSMSATSDRLSFFSSLDRLELINLPRLKGIRSSVFSRTEARRKLVAVQSFPRLIDLRIEDCPCLTTVPRCPSLKCLAVTEVHEAFRFRGIDDDSPCDSTIYLDDLTIDREMFSAAADLFQRHASSIESLDLSNCKELKSLCGGGIEQLTNLRYLNLWNSINLDLGEGDDCGMSPWKSLKNLRKLDLWSLSNLIYLPQGFQHLTSLTSLRIDGCSLESLPEWLPSLTSLSSLCLHTCNELKSLPKAIRHMPTLRELEVSNCKHLTDRCREPDGQDWHKISHIRTVIIRSK